MGFFSRLGHRARAFVHTVGADIRGGEAWLANHTVRPVSHLVGSAGQLIGRAERFAGDNIKRLGHTIVSDEQALVGGIKHGLHNVETVIGGVGQVIGRLGHDVGAVWTGAEKMMHYVPIVLGGGAVLWAAKEAKALSR